MSKLWVKKAENVWQKAIINCWTNAEIVQASPILFSNWTDAIDHLNAGARYPPGHTIKKYMQYLFHLQNVHARFIQIQKELKDGIVELLLFQKIFTKFIRNASSFSEITFLIVSEKSLLMWMHQHIYVKDSMINYKCFKNFEKENIWNNLSPYDILHTKNIKVAKQYLYRTRYPQKILIEIRKFHIFYYATIDLCNAFLKVVRDI